MRFHVSIENDFIVTQTGTSEGTQIKYKKDGYWYKLNRDGREGLCEYLAAKLLTFSNLEADEYVLYEQGMINGMPGCRSRDFLRNGENLITIYRLYYNEFGQDLSAVIRDFEYPEERIRYVVDFVKTSTGLDITDYLAKTITLDRIILNEDRHLNNLAIIEKNDQYRPAPLFDNGRSLLTANYSVRSVYGLDRNVKCAVAKPFSGSYDTMFYILGEGFSLDREAAISWLKEEEDSAEKDVLVYQLRNCR